MRKTRDAFHLKERTPFADARMHFTGPAEYQTDANLRTPVLLGIAGDRDWLCLGERVGRALEPRL